jgi:hypothetical protein
MKQTFPRWEKPPKYTPETMVPRLNLWGEAGWEIIHMEPVFVGNNGDIGFKSGGEASHFSWTNTYFVVMKRKRDD